MFSGAREDLHDALDLAVAADHRVDRSFAGQAREIRAELPERAGYPALFRRFERYRPDAVHDDLGAEVVPCSEALQFVGDHLGGHAVHFEDAGRGGRAVAGYGEQGVARGDASGILALCAQLVGEAAEKLFGRTVPGAGPAVADLVLDAQTDLVEFPVAQACREELEGERTLLAEQLQREEILERVGDSRLRGVESRAGDEPLQRFRNLQLHGCIVFLVSPE